MRAETPFPAGPRAVLLAGAIALAGFLSGTAAAQGGGPDDPAIEESEAALPGSYGIVRGLLIEPVDVDEEAPAVLVIHDRKGLDDHARAVARRLAKAGYVTMAVDMLSTAGDTPDTPVETAESVDALPPDVALDTARAAANWLETHPLSSGEVGIVGFGWGGAVGMRLAGADAPVRAVVAYYFEDLPPDAMAGILDTPVLLHYAGAEDGAHGRIADFTKALDTERLDYRVHIYDGMSRGFDDPGAGEAYHEGASQEAFRRTVDFLKDRLGA